LSEGEASVSEYPDRSTNTDSKALLIHVRGAAHKCALFSQQQKNVKCLKQCSLAGKLNVRRAWPVNKMSTEPSPPQQPNPTLLAALYQVTAGWYANDAQLVWQRLALFVTLNTGLIAAQVFASELHLLIRIALPLLGVIFSCCWFLLLRRMWHYQDFQAAVLRDQEHAMGLDQLGAYSRAYAIRNQSVKVHISGLNFSATQLSSNFRNRHFTISLIPVFICFHVALFAVAIAGVSLQAVSGTEATPLTTPTVTTKSVLNPEASPPSGSATPAAGSKP
jgi:hypothetical protein